MKAKEKILQEAAILFAKKGFAETSADEIIANSGTSKGLLFYHFQNKDGLLKAVLEKAWQIITGSCSYDISDKRGGFALKQVIKQMVNSLLRESDYWKIYNAVKLNPVLMERIEYTMPDISTAYLNITKDLFSKVGKKNPSRWALSFDIHFRGIMIGFLNDPSGYPIEDSKLVMIGMFTR